MIGSILVLVLAGDRKRTKWVYFNSSAESELMIPLGQKIEAEKNGDTVLIRGSPVGRGDYNL